MTGHDDCSINIVIVIGIIIIIIIFNWRHLKDVYFVSAVNRRNVVSVQSFLSSWSHLSDLPFSMQILEFLNISEFDLSVIVL